MELLSEAQISICRRVSAMECELEAMEGRMSAGQTIDLDQYGRLAGRLCRLFELLVGVKRLARPIDPLSDLAKGLEAYPATMPIDDDGDGSDDERQPIEEAVDPAKNGGSDSN